ncbi:MAG: hypothetical protein F4047_12430 [Caldilineaceae bacterium SB0670_bin_27]|uniref:Uncharacterized protein n=1 Tax=Caldilineaceae bacterium SB0664_bin_27 TaxID=2605260 RepID=A0A6B0YY21_9CHLR|nr:hypothetical protein [Caldilineaceae bacterium SB0664_bin_27]MYJ78920.1 hypothetical protein [Caldilineaceae bacterium SB0670_bin_27]
MDEKYRIYIFSALSHCAVTGAAFLIVYLMQLAWPELGPRHSGSFRLVDSFLISLGVGFVAIPFLNPYEASYRYFFKGGRDKKR